MNRFHIEPFSRLGFLMFGTEELDWACRERCRIPVSSYINNHRTRPDNHYIARYVVREDPISKFPAFG